ncbi:helix-turn-helix domain-containing protein [Laribacter hongkongensis]|uniref:helix-turn-helix domain-containing protein n=1 Tax=Laribacter hongkongensis TaxID=168471 RepID=UPI001EFCB0B8|nr:helix-turn-helix domain-containing protein [Laribacter hongkongensis]MCG9107183.1 helix-turn-helix domain-containing protein [Laribacter hongkongensis]
MFQFWRDAFEQFLLEHWRGELCGRHRLFQPATVQKHPNKSLAHVVRGAGIGLKSLRRLVHQDRVPVSEFVYPSQRKLLTIDISKLESFIPDATTYLDLRSVARLFGLKPARIRQLVAAGVLLADAEPKEGGDYRWRFRRQVVEDFLGSIRMRGHIALADDEVSLKHGLRHWRLAPKEFCALIAAVSQGQLGFVLNVQDGLDGLMFNRCELRGWLDRLRATSTDWITPVEAAKRLGLKEQVVYELVSKQLLAADLVPRQGRVFKRISLRSLEQFQAEYVSLATLAKVAGTSASLLLRQIEAQPVTGPRVDGGRQYFYRRADLSPAIADVSSRG